MTVVFAIAGRMFPRAVITDRSAITGGPAEGVLYLAHDGRGREAELPGMTVIARLAQARWTAT
jgi:hypothetical protein